MSDSACDTTEPAFPHACAINDAEVKLVYALDLARIQLPSNLASDWGVFRGTPVSLVARAYSSRLVRYATFVTMTGDSLGEADSKVDVGTLFMMPSATLAAPSLTIDLLTLGHNGRVAADLSPVAPSNLDCALIRLAGLPLASPHRSHDRAETEHFVRAHSDAFASCLRSATAGDMRDRNRARLRDLRHAAPSRNALAKVFGSLFASRFISSVLYPSLLGAWIGILELVP